MKKSVLVGGASLLAVVAAVVIAGIIRFNFTDGGDVLGDQKRESEIRDLAITIDNQTFRMSNGVAELPAEPGSATQNTLRIVGEPVVGDINGDGEPDAALLIRNDPGGSGTFYYAVVAINDARTYHASNVLPLGDRIEPQTVVFTDGHFVYNFAERKPGEPMSERPSVEKTVTISVDNATGVIAAS